jgi:hypothetical protein
MTLDLLLDSDSFLFPSLCSQGDMKSNEIASEEPENEPKVTNVPNHSSVEVDTQVTDQLHQVQTFSK